MHKYTFLLIALSVLACHAWTSPLAMAQGPQPWSNVGSGDWNDFNNWENTFLPNSAFGDTALINNGGTATLIAAATNPIGGVAVGPGSLELTSSGSLSVVDVSGLDASATGFFRIGPGGTLTLADNASVNVAGDVTLVGSTNVTGPNVTFSTQSAFAFDPTSVYNANISNQVTHSVFSADGSSTLGGALNVEFSGGVTPGLGDAWTLVDSPTINGNFSTVQGSGFVLSLGQVLGVRKIAGGSGTLAQLSVQERLVLRVDRQNGSTTLLNPGTTSISFDGYTVNSALGALAPSNGNWNSLEDQAVSSWVEVPSTSQALGELENSVGGSLTIVSGGGQQVLGSAFDPLLPFGSPDPADLVFEYHDATAGTLTGLVQYVGTPTANNLILTVDSTTGNAQVRNASPTISVDLQGYTLTSVGGSLLASFDSDLPSAEWAETAGSDNGVGELNFAASGSTTLAPNATFNLTGVFLPSGTEDLVFQFRRQQSVAFEGDFNNDGQVDGDDLTDWEARYGVDLDGSDFLAWQRNLGNVGSTDEIITGITRYDGTFPLVALTTAVPEPSSGLIGLIAVLTAQSVRRRSPNFYGNGAYQPGNSCLEM